MTNLENEKHMDAQILKIFIWIVLISVQLSGDNFKVGENIVLKFEYC